MRDTLIKTGSFLKKAYGAVAARRWAVVTLGALAVTALVALRVGVVLRFTPKQNVMYSESLVRFRYAQMIMDGKPLPDPDYLVQWPEGFRRRDMILWFPDHLTGESYRLWAGVFGRPDQYTFLRYFMAAYNALYVPAALLLFLVMFRRFWPAWLAAAFYVTSFPTFIRAAGTYLREDFASPPLLLATALTWYLLTDDGTSARRRRLATVALGVAVVWALSSWHMAQFYLNLVLGVAFLAALAAPRRAYGAIGLAFLAGTAAAAALNHPLFVKGVMWSPTIAAALGLCVWGYSRRVRGLGSRPALVALVLALVAVSLVLARGGAYNHVYALVLAKLRYAGVHPDDPLHLPLDARIFWMGPYDTTTPRRLAVEYGPALPLAAAVFVWALAWGRRGKPGLGFFGVAMTAGTAFLYWLIVRLTIFFAPWVAMLVVLPAARARRLGTRWAWVGAAVLLVAYQCYWDFTYYRITPLRNLMERVPEPQEPLWNYGFFDSDPFGWLEKNTPPGAAVLAQFGISASVMYWGKRPTALHPMFEVPEIRPKTVEVSRAYMGTEEDFYRLCRRWRISYVMFSAPIFLADVPPADRYYAGIMNPPPDAVGRQMQFAPETLKRFRLVYETYDARIFEVGKPYASYRALRFHPYFDPDTFPDLPTREQLLALKMQVGRAAEHYTRGLAAEKRGRFGAAAAHYALALKLHPDYEDAELRLGFCLVQAGRLADAEPHFRRALLTFPDYPQAHTYMGSYYVSVGQFGPALEEYRRAAALAPGDVEATRRLAWAEKYMAGG